MLAEPHFSAKNGIAALVCAAFTQLLHGGNTPKTALVSKELTILVANEGSSGWRKLRLGRP